MELKERCFEVIDDLIERDIDVLNLGKSLPKRDYESLRKRLIRNFGSVQQALIEYGFYDTNGTPSTVELARCFDINDNYDVVENKYRKNHIMDVYFLDDLTFNQISRTVKEQAERDALDDFYRHMFPFDQIPHAVIRYGKYKHIRNYIAKFYGDRFDDFADSYGFPRHIFVDRSYVKTSIENGRIFEEMLSEILFVLHGSVNRNYYKSGCKPDFVVKGDHWIDAKLSYFTVFDRRCVTVEKYSLYTNNLTVYYARFKKPSFNYRKAKIRHVSELYPNLLELGRKDLIDKMELFINKTEKEAI